MPLTDLQKRILRADAANRDPENYVAGGAVLNVDTDRFSDDIDPFPTGRRTWTAWRIGTGIRCGRQVFP